MSKDLLIEIGTEELPPKALKSLATAFCDGICAGLSEKDLTFSDKTWFATPRRLAVVIKGLIEKAEDKSFEIHGPPVKAAKDKDGNWTKAATGFAAKNKVEPEQLSVVNTDKGERLAVTGTATGVQSVDCLPEIVNDALKNLPIPKRMRWGAGSDEFVRPVHWSVILFGSDIVPASILGTTSSNTTRGHRFHCDTTLTIANPGVYQTLLEKDGHVIADFAQRQSIIEEQVNAAADKVGGTAVIDADLLNEVTAIVEWPMALAGQFDSEFLAVPAEALISTMQDHQKYFPVVDSSGKLMPYFITVANINSSDPQKVIDGNERVIRPRFSDAKFFFETDKQQRLDARLEKLKAIVFQQKLGTVFEKSERIAKLAAYIANKIEANTEHAERAGLLCKADLVSDMVLEFETMQGVAGYYYAQNDGEADDVAIAIRDQYLPKFAGDELPESLVACAVGLADRLDTLVGIFGIGQPPTGSKDPFALRRASLSVLRILVEKQLKLDLRELLTQALQLHQSLDNDPAIVDTVLNYMIDRFRAWYEEANIPAQVFQAVSARDISEPCDFNDRVLAVHAFNQLPEAESLAAANKRVSNILAKHDGTVSDSINTSLLKEASETALANTIETLSAQVTPLFAERNYEQGLKQLAAIRETVDAFFDNVMVNVDDLAIRDNRLALLQQLRNLFLQVADISLLAGSGK